MIENYDDLARTSAHELALDCVTAGIEAAQPAGVIERLVHVDGAGRSPASSRTQSGDGDTLYVADATYDLSEYEEVVVLGGGNAAAHVAQALEDVLGDRIDRGVVVTDDPLETHRIDVLPGDHPTPSERGVESAHELLALAEDVDEDTLVLGVITGGGSALMAAPAEGISLADLQTTTNALLASGASIHEINAVRKHLSALKGGLLARRLAPATVSTLVFSDVTGNDLDVIASGPVVPDSSTFADALDVLEEYDLDVPDAVRDRLERGAAGHLPETPTEGDPIFENVSTHVLADNFTALDAAREVAEDAGYDTMILSSTVRGEAREAAHTHVAIAEEALTTGNPADPPLVVLSGGETTVTVRGEGGEGGPNQEFATAAALSLPDGAVLAAVDTDGIDGATDAAGAIVDADTVDDPKRARRTLKENHVHPFLAARRALIETGPTGTNVNDLRVLVVR